MDGLNEHHRRHLVTTFKYLDELLGGSLHAVNAVDSPFAQYVGDMQPAQRKALEDQLHELRRRMADTLQRADIPLPPPTISACWGFRTAIVSARIETEELRPSHIRGYGEVSGEAVRLLEEIASELDDQLDRMESYLVQPKSADLESRVEDLARATNIRSAPLLSALTRAVVKHGLNHFRAPVAALVERAGKSELEVAVFGRVSSGKSSLLDYLLQTDLLPVGVTPVTAFPTRIRFGRTPQLNVSFVGQRSQILTVDHLREFVTEQDNPDNRRHVAQVELELPSPRLEQGIVFVDTPGLGSLARRGAAETMAYLPRCDLGLVLVDSATTLLHEDIQLVDALLRVGAQAMVLLTKADMLSADDRPIALEYLKRNLREQLERDVPVHLVSIRGADARLCDQWAGRVLAAQQSAHERHVQEAFAHKLEVLYESVLATLTARSGDNATPGAPPALADDSPRSMLAALEEYRRQNVNAFQEVEELADAILSKAADEFISHPDGDASLETTLAQEFAEQSLERGRNAYQALEELRKRVASASREGAQTLDGDSDVPPIAGLPVPPAWSPPPLGRVHLGLNRLLRRTSRTRAVIRELSKVAGSQLRADLRTHLDRLEAWRQEVLQELRRALQSQAQGHTVMADPTASDGRGAGELQADVDELVRAHDALMKSAPAAVRHSHPGDVLHPTKEAVE